MKKAIYLRFVTLTCAAVLICSLATAVLFAVHTQNRTENWMVNLTLSASALYRYDQDVDALSRALGGNRVTIIAHDGTVLADSEANILSLETHANRPEVRRASTYHVTTAMRSSSTLGRRFIYAAIRTDDGNILRLAHTYAGWLYHVNELMPAIFLVIMLVFVLSLYLSRRFTRTVTDPFYRMIEAIANHESDYTSPYEEIEKVMRSVRLLFQHLTDEQLLEQQKRDFFSNASHELKTPITSIIGFAEMLNKDMIADSEKAAILTRIETEAKRMNTLIGDILTISKLETREADDAHEELNFAAVVREAVEAVSPVNEDSMIAMTLSLEEVIFYANKQRIYELCVNLIENAVKYNKPNGTVDVTLTSDETHIVLCIKDSGIGISPEHQARVFERFYRADLGRDKKIGGTGLGLAIVKHIVNSYDGNIALHSELGIGTEVIVRLKNVC